MKAVTSLQYGALGLALFLAGCAKDSTPEVTPQSSITQDAAKNPNAPATATVTVFATGLQNPRGLEFGPDGYLYVAEGGPGGTH